MGPVIIFDKSTLQSISIDESVFVQQFFISNIIPLFYVETLGDLDLVYHKSGKPITEVISALAAKVPSLSVSPSVHHSRLIVGNLYGLEVEMDGRIIRDGGVEKVDYEGKVGIHYSSTPEAAALRRWHKGEYLDIERLFSKSWRDALSNSTFDNLLGIIKNIVPVKEILSNADQIKLFVERFVKVTDGELLIYLICEFSGLPEKVYLKSIERWRREKHLNIEKFSSYALFVLKVDLFFYICMYKGVESKDRPSHRIDLAYLYYLPFCDVFVSTDKLHKRLVPHFLRKDQLFVNGSDFKTGLHRLDEYYSQYQEQIAEVGFLSFAQSPPQDIKNGISDIWDVLNPTWRIIKPKKENKINEKELLKHLRKVSEESKELDRKTPMNEVQHISEKYLVSVQKGKYRVLPKNIENISDTDESAI